MPVKDIKVSLDSWINKCRRRDSVMDRCMDGGRSAPSPYLSFHVLIYSVWLIPFTPAAGVIPLDVRRAPTPTSQQPLLSLSPSPSSPLFFLSTSLGPPAGLVPSLYASLPLGNGAEHAVTMATIYNTASAAGRKESQFLIWRICRFTYLICMDRTQTTEEKKSVQTFSFPL